MPTQRGWMLAAGAVLLGVAGRLFAVVELFMVAAVAGALFAAACGYVHLGRFRLQATRELRPARVHAGAASRVELAVRNQGRRRSPVLAARDPFDGGRRAAHFLLAPLAPGETARAAYRLPTEERGVFALGPLALELSDPFGLATSRAEAAPTTRLVVYPRVDRVPAPGATGANDSHAGIDHPTALALGGGDFYAIREYEVGDDLRQVHWKSTAKLGELMIRQEELPWQARATVVLDLRRDVHTPASLEVAVSAAASIVTAMWSRRGVSRLVATGGMDSGFGTGAAHVEAVLEHLAGVDLQGGTHMAPVLAALRRPVAPRAGAGPRAGALVVVTTAAASDADLAGVARLPASFAPVTLVLLEGWEAHPGLPRAARPPRAVPTVASVVRVTPETPFASAWSRATASAAAGTGSRT